MKLEDLELNEKYIYMPRSLRRGMRVKELVTLKGFKRQTGRRHGDKTIILCAIKKNETSRPRYVQPEYLYKVEEIRAVEKRLDEAVKKSKIWGPEE